MHFSEIIDAVEVWVEGIFHFKQDVLNKFGSQQAVMNVVAVGEGIVSEVHAVLSKLQVVLPAMGVKGRGQTSCDQRVLGA